MGAWDLGKEMNEADETSKLEVNFTCKGCVLKKTREYNFDFVHWVVKGKRENCEKKLLI